MSKQPWFDTGRQWLDLLASVSRAYGPAPVERVGDLDDLVEWLCVENLIPVAAPTADDLAAFRTLREALRSILTTRKPPPAAIATVNATLDGRRNRFPIASSDGASPGETFREVTIGLEPAPGGGVRRVRPADTSVVLAILAAQAVDDLTGPASAALRQCAGEDCRMYFHDPTGKRRWCADAVCGSRARVRALRARRAASK
ncbi:CGNR zinc finger domain-containing protein [Fodinicola acaciae]|uniref:CGNR zinc finger domain-containing protein n=1 Tax=Fodinicola acaciae TaxID=2681555 RepID=UPI0013D47848|nr:CGNR zinc finger domain-containing protein [Fodinicola acaciae]